MSDFYSIMEPLGYLKEDSKFERCWDSFSGCYGIHPIRITQFDPYASMSRQPDKYMLEKFSITKENPSELWIKSELENFVNDEFFSEEIMDFQEGMFPEIDEIVEVNDRFLESFLEKSEWNNLTKIEIPINDSVNDIASDIYDLLCKPQIGSSKNNYNVDKLEFISKIDNSISSHARLFFVIPGCPFKDQNRFRVPYKADCPDFGEISFLIRLHNLIESLYQIHPFGGQVILLSDGRLYKDIFKINDKDVDNYLWRLKYYRNKLNIQGDVSILDLKDMIDRADVNGEISNIIAYIKNVLRTKYMGLPCFNALIQGMKWNINSKCFLGKLSDEEAWKIIKNQRTEVESKLLDYWDEFNEMAIEAALQYSTVNLMLKWTNLIMKFFPTAIRCTVHPKKDQIALAMNYAWNGVAWSEKWPKNITDITAIPFYKLQKYKKVNLVRFKADGYPCFFTREKQHRIFDCAKNVLSAEGWNFGDFFGREFTIYDNIEFIELAKDDPNFVWQRKKMPEDYFTELLEFRINHYKKYGFGVHAIFKNNKLIGQMGLQVLDEEEQHLEYVIFLGKDFVGQGIGTQLLSYLFERCRKVGIMIVFGVIRMDNEPSIRLAKKFNGKEQGSISHYKQEAILYEIKL